MATRLTKKQKTFVGEFLATGNGTQSALKAYDTEDPRVAQTIASENLSKPIILEAIDSALNDDKLEDKHQQLLNAMSLEKLSFDDDEDDDVIKDVVSKMPGYQLLYIRRNLTDNGNVLSCYAYVSAPDNLIQEKALDKAYKLKGKYAAEKHLNVNVQVEASDKVKDLAKKLNA